MSPRGIAFPLLAFLLLSLLCLAPIAGAAPGADTVPAPPEDVPLPKQLAGDDGAKPAAPAPGEKPAKELPGAGDEKPLAPASAPDRTAANELPGDRKIYVPFKNLKDVFEKEGQGVFVPYSEFLKLWNANLDRRPVPAEPPVPYLVTRAAYEGVVDGGLAVVKAKIEFETFTEGWSSVPLGFSGVSMGEATIGGKPASLSAGKDGFRILVPSRGSWELSLTFVAPVVKKEDERTVAFRVPSTPVSRIVFDVPEEDARVTVDPNLATTRTEPGSGTTRVMAYVGAAEAIRISWRPKPAAIETGPALVFAEGTLVASVEEAVLRTHAEFDYRIYRTPVSVLRLAVPAGSRVLFVEGEEIRQWEVGDGVLTVTLHRPVQGDYRLTVTLERDRPESGTIPVPEVTALDVAREQGTVLVRAPATVRVVPAAKGLYRTEMAQLAKALVTPDLQFAWRYPSHPWSVDLSVSRLLARVEVEGRTRVSIDERTVDVVDQLTFVVSRAPVFERRLLVPKGLNVVEVSRDSVEDWRLVDGENGTRVLVLDLKGSLTGRFGVRIQSRMPLELKDAPLGLALPLLTPLDVERTSGLLGIARDDSLKLETGETKGLTPVGAATFGEGVALAFRYSGEERVLPLTIRRREAEVTARVDTSLTAQENRIAVRSRITWTVKHAGVEEFSFTLPAALKDQFQVTGNNIREKPVEDAGDGRIRQRIVLQGKTLGDYVLTVEYDLPYEGLGIGESKTIAVPSLVPENVKRDEGTYAVYREPMLEVTANADRLEPIDPRELPAGTGGPDVFLAFKYLVRPHSLSLEIVKHEFLPVLSAVVRHLQVVTVLNEEGTARTEAIFAMTNNGLQFLSVKADAPPDTLEIYTRDARKRLVRKKEVPQKGAGGAILVRMPSDAGPDEVFFVKLVYSTRGELPGAVFHGLAFRAPAVEGGAVPILGTSWYVYPPAGTTITRTGGSLTWYDEPDSWLTAVGRAFSDILPGHTSTVVVSRDGKQLAIPAEIEDLAPRNQSALRFGGRVQNPTVEVTFASPGAFTAIRVLVLLLVLAFGVLALGRRSGRVRSLFVFGCVALPLLLAPVAAVGTAKVLSAVLFGGVLAGATLLARDISTGIAARRRAAALIAASAPADAEEE